MKRAIFSLFSSSKARMNEVCPLGIAHKEKFSLVFKGQINKLVFHIVLKRKQHGHFTQILTSVSKI